MTWSAMHSYTATLCAVPTGSASYSALAECMKISGPGIDVKSVDITHLRSANGYKDFMAGFADSGELTLELLFDQAEYAALLGYLRNSGIAWQLTFPKVGAQATAATLVFKGFITKLGQEIPEDDKVTN